MTHCRDLQLWAGTVRGEQTWFSPMKNALTASVTGACTQLINRHSIYYSNDWRRRELDELWVTDPQYRQTASLGYNNGYYVGMDAIAQHYVLDREAQRYEWLKPYHEAEQTPLCRENLGLARPPCTPPPRRWCILLTTAAPPAIRATSWAISPPAAPDGTAESYLEFGPLYADLVREEDGWKIWHLVMEHDHTVEVERPMPMCPSGLPDSGGPAGAGITARRRWSRRSITRCSAGSTSGRICPAL